MEIKINEDNNNLYCCYSKEPIEVGEKYVEIKEVYVGETIVKSYKLEYAPTSDDDEDPYIIED